MTKVIRQPIRQVENRLRCFAGGSGIHSTRSTGRSSRRELNRGSSTLKRGPSGMLFLVGGRTGGLAAANIAQPSGAAKRVRLHRADVRAYLADGRLRTILFLMRVPTLL